MTYRNLIDLRDTMIMTALTNNMPEENRMAFMDQFQAACKSGDEWLFQDQLPILFDGQEKAEAVRKHLDDQIAVQ